MNASLRRTNTHWLFGYQKEWLRWDLMAGLITAAVVIPKAMAFATIAGLPVQVGLYTILVPMTIYAMVGTSRPLSVSTTTTLAILAASALSRVAVPGDPTSLMKACATLTLLVGVILLLAALLRLGFVANFISEPVLIGFKAGIAFAIVLDQIPKLLGVHIAKGNFVHNLVATLQAVPHTSLPTLVVGTVMIVSLVAARFFPRAPAPLIVVAIGIAGVRLFRLAELWCRNRRPNSSGPAVLYATGRRTPRAIMARCPGYRANELYRNDRRGTRFRDK